MSTWHGILVMVSVVLLTACGMLVGDAGVGRGPAWWLIVIGGLLVLGAAGGALMMQRHERRQTRRDDRGRP